MSVVSCRNRSMNLAAWAERNGVARVTAYRWFRAGLLPVPAQRVGRLILVNDAAAEAPRRGRTVVYARVSSADQKSDLDRQVARVTAWATTQQMPVDKVVTEVGSALNGHRRKFLGLLRDPAVTRIVVEHRDRFCRFGSEYVEAALSGERAAQNRAETDKPSLRVLRKRSNQAKGEVCVNAETGEVWWPECSKEVYADGIDGAVEAYWNWQQSRAGTRAGKRVGFPQVQEERPRRRPGVVHDRSDARGVRSPPPEAAGHRDRSHAGEHPPDRTADPCGPGTGAGNQRATQRHPPGCERSGAGAAPAAARCGAP